ncbi:hypothetical protein Q5752_003772 [Cryptotrichosporon argae]
MAATLSPYSSFSSTETAAPSPLPPAPKLRDGIRIARYTSLEHPASLVAPLSRVLSTVPAPASPEPNPYKGSGTREDPYLVDWLPGELANPYNWKSSYRWFVTAIVAISTLCIAFASSSYSGAIADISGRFGVSTEVGILGLSLYVVGFGVGPLLWAPLSEMTGRVFSFNVSYPLFVLFNMAGALAQNIETVLVIRFLAGTFGSAPLTNAGGQISDMWAVHERALATSFYALAPFLGPVLGPIVGGFTDEFAGFRWVFAVQTIFVGPLPAFYRDKLTQKGAVMLVLSVLFVPETYAPTLLRRKAVKLQKQADEEGTGEVFVSKFDVVRKAKAEIVKTGLTRPFALLFRELIVACLAIYAAIIYGTLYLFFEAFPIVFEENRGWSLGVSGLSFLGIGVGLVVGTALTPLNGIYYRRAAARAAARGERTPPEARLPLCCVGAVMLPVALFWFAWTSTPNVHWLVPIVASGFFGCGFLWIFTAMMMYIIDSYTIYAASALAANAVARSVFGAVFPLFATYMYTNLGLQWAGTLLAFLSLACMPMPFLFWKYGAFLRRKSKYAPSAPLASAPAATPQPKEPITADEALEPEYAADAGEHDGEGVHQEGVVSAEKTGHQVV